MGLTQLKSRPKLDFGFQAKVEPSSSSSGAPPYDGIPRGPRPMVCLCCKKPHHRYCECVNKPHGFKPMEHDREVAERVAQDLMARGIFAKPKGSKSPYRAGGYQGRGEGACKRSHVA